MKIKTQRYRWDYYVDLDTGKYFAWHREDSPPVGNLQTLTEDQYQEIAMSRLSEKEAD